MQVDALLRVVLTGVTYGGGLRINRAILLLVDESRHLLVGRLAVGPSSGDEAATIWGTLTVRAPSAGRADLIRDWRTARSRKSRPSTAWRGASEPPCHREDQSVLVRATLEARAFAGQRRPARRPRPVGMGEPAGRGRVARAPRWLPKGR